MRTEAEIRALLDRRRDALARVERSCLERHARAHFQECAECWDVISTIDNEVDILEWVLRIERMEEVPPEPMCGPWEEE